MDRNILVASHSQQQPTGLVWRRSVQLHRWIRSSNQHAVVTIGVQLEICNASDGTCAVAVGPLGSCAAALCELCTLLVLCVLGAVNRQKQAHVL